MDSNVFEVVVNGNQFIASYDDYKKALNRCLRLARSCKRYVELWIVKVGSSRRLLDYWN